MGRVEGILEIGPDFIKCLKELIKVFLKDHDRRADVFAVILPALSDFDDVIAIVLLFEIEKVRPFACCYFFAVELFVLIFHVPYFTDSI